MNSASRRLTRISAQLHGQPISIMQSPTSAAASVCKLSDEVREGIAAGRPIVALESTIISHGMPYPENLRCAQVGLVSM